VNFQKIGNEKISIAQLKIANFNEMLAGIKLHGPSGIRTFYILTKDIGRSINGIRR
jgi:hypothetical protein